MKVQDGEKAKESISYKIPKRSVNCLLVVIALTSSCESVRRQMCRVDACNRAPLMAKASATITEAMFAWGKEPRWSSCDSRSVKIQPNLAAFLSDLQTASVLQKIAVEWIRWGWLECLLFIVCCGLSIWACSHFFWEVIAFVAASRGVRVFFSKMRRFREVQIDQKNQGIPNNSSRW